MGRPNRPTVGLGLGIALGLFILLRVFTDNPAVVAVASVVVAAGIAISWLFRGPARRNTSPPRTPTAPPRTNHAGWYAPPGWSYSPTNDVLAQSWRSQGVAIPGDDEIGNVLLSVVDEHPVSVFQTTTSRGHRTWALVWVGSMLDFKARAGGGRALHVAEGAAVPRAAEQALAELDGQFSRVESAAPFLVGRLTRNDPVGVIAALDAMPAFVQIAEAVRTTGAATTVSAPDSSALLSTPMPTVDTQIVAPSTPPSTLMAPRAPEPTAAPNPWVAPEPAGAPEPPAAPEPGSVPAAAEAAESGIHSPWESTAPLGGDPSIFSPWQSPAPGTDDSLDASAWEPTTWQPTTWQPPDYDGDKA